MEIKNHFADSNYFVRFYFRFAFTDCVVHAFEAKQLFHGSSAAVTVGIHPSAAKSCNLFSHNGDSVHSENVFVGHLLVHVLNKSHLNCDLPEKCCRAFGQQPIY